MTLNVVSKFRISLVALERKSTLDGLFARYNAKAKELLDLVAGSDKYERVFRDHSRELELKCLFDEEFALWFKKSREIATCQAELFPAPREGTPGTPHTTVLKENEPRPYPPRATSHERPLQHQRKDTREPIPQRSCGSSCAVLRDADLQSSSGSFRDMPLDDESVFSTRSYAGESRGSSRISKASQSSKAKLAMARLQVKRVEEEQRLLSRQQHLEHEKQRLDMEKELLETRYEAEQAQIEVDFSVSGGNSEHTFEALNHLPKQTSCDVVEKYFQPFEDGSFPPGQSFGVSSMMILRSILVL